MNSRYIVTPWHGEAATVYYVIDTHALAQPAVVEAFINDPNSAWAYAGALNDMESK
jgi:hypothetical protein